MKDLLQKAGVEGKTFSPAVARFSPSCDRKIHYQPNETMRLECFAFTKLDAGAITGLKSRM